MTQEDDRACRKQLVRVVESIVVRICLGTDK